MGEQYSKVVREIVYMLIVEGMYGTVLQIFLGKANDFIGHIVGILYMRLP